LKRKKGSFSFGILFVIALIVGGVLYVYNSSMFERELPTVILKNSKYWNLKKPLQLEMDDTSGIKSYKVVLKAKNGDTTLYYEQLLSPKQSVKLEIAPPRSAYAMKDKIVRIVVEAVDASKWNLLNGNIARKEFLIKIDKKRPNVNIVTNSYKISRGGSALVIFKASDENLKDLYIQTSFGKKFKVEPFYEDGYYISLLAWPIRKNGFRATVIATDYAGNIAKAYIPLYLKQKTYRVSKINLSDRFLKGKIAQLADEFAETQGVDDSLEQFKIINEDVRAKNEEIIHKITSKVSDERISDFKINKMYPLKNAQVVATFGDHRKYYYDGKYISQSYHLGLDLASNAMAAIKPQNGGSVVFADYNGLYGNMPIVDHGLGLYTLYGHCSSVSVSSGDEIQKKETIANTGKTGYAMGDHLHFGVLVQGIEVRPQEWMDKTWMKLNINNVIKSAKEIIDKN